MMIPQLKYCYKTSDAGQIIEESYIEQKAIAGYCFQNIVFNQITFVKPLVFESCYFENCTFNYCDINSLILRNVYITNCTINYCRLSEINTFHSFIAGLTFVRSEILIYENINSKRYGRDIFCNFYNCYVHNFIFENNDRIIATATKNCINAPYYSLNCPSHGSFIGWKKVFIDDELANHTGIPMIAKLLIPEDAERLSGADNKCSCNKAKVLEIQTLDGESKNDLICYSLYNPHFLYKVGETVTTEKPFNKDRWEICSSGIHFFIDRQSAVDYSI